MTLESVLVELRAADRELFNVELGVLRQLLDHDAMRAEIARNVLRRCVDEVRKRHVAFFRRREDAVVRHFDRNDFAGPMDVMRRLSGILRLRYAASRIGGDAAFPQNLGVLPRLDLESHASFSKLSAPDLLVGAIGDPHHLLAVLFDRVEDLVEELIRDIDSRPKIDVAVSLGKNREAIAEADVVVAESRPRIEGV